MRLPSLSALSRSILTPMHLSRARWFILFLLSVIILTPTLFTFLVNLAFAQPAPPPFNSALAARVAAFSPAVVSVNAPPEVGSGIILTPDGLMITASHVVAHASTISVYIVARGTFSATLLVLDPTHQQALLQIENAHDLPTLDLATAPPFLHEAVAVLGYPGGLGDQPRVTTGNLTKLNASVTVRVDASHTQTLSSLLVANAPVSGGESGGPLLTANGQVLGMLVAGGGGLEYATIVNLCSLSSSLSLSLACP